MGLVETETELKEKKSECVGVRKHGVLFTATGVTKTNV